MVQLLFEGRVWYDNEKRSDWSRSYGEVWGYGRILFWGCGGRRMACRMAWRNGGDTIGISPVTGQLIAYGIWLARPACWRAWSWRGPGACLRLRVPLLPIVFDERLFRSVSHHNRENKILTINCPDCAAGPHDFWNLKVLGYIRDNEAGLPRHLTGVFVFVVQVTG